MTPNLLNSLALQFLGLACSSGIGQNRRMAGLPFAAIASSQQLVSPPRPRPQTETHTQFSPR